MHLYLYRLSWSLGECGVWTGVDSPTGNKRSCSFLAYHHLNEQIAIVLQPRAPDRDCSTKSVLQETLDTTALLICLVDHAYRDSSRNPLKPDFEGLLPELPCPRTPDSAELTYHEYY
ncbi:hypothetical protein PM082_017557 [Marasmius tenuissimus]|nr:hypothetical protein PM082_017557 [Marasmius tenuissimus]